MPHLGNAMDARNATVTTPIGLFETLTLFLFSVGAASILLLVLNHFASIYALLIGAFFMMVSLKFFRCKIVISDKKFDLYIGLILILTLFFISKPYLYIIGGQDQGVYVSMSATYERSGSTFIKDVLRNNLTDSEKKIYDHYNQYAPSNIQNGVNEGQHAPGVFIKNLAESEYVFQFYPLHPIWMAIFGKLLGQDNRVYAVVFFALISIVAFYLLAYELSGRKLAGYLIALLLAINPLFTFFSKFPVSEMMLVAFSSLGFYYLLLYYNGIKRGENIGFYLFLSSLSFFSLFFAHISGFIYIPLFYLLLLLTLIFITDGSIRKKLLIYNLFVLFYYFLSLWYGLVYSFPYSSFIYDVELASRLAIFNWKLELSLLIIIMTFLPFVIYRARQSIKVWIVHFSTYFFNLTSFLIVLLIPMNIYGMYKLGSKLNTLPDFLYSSSSFFTLLYLTPFGFILFLGALNHYRKSCGIEHFLFLLSLLLFWILKVYVPAENGYQYYSSRYIFNEVIVYSLLLIALYSDYLLKKSGIKRLFACLLLASLFIYSIYFTAYQLRGQVADGANQALKNVASPMDEKDLLLLTFTDYKILTPLKYYFGLNTFIVGLKDVNDRNFSNNLLDRFNDIFILSLRPLPNDYLEIVNIIPYKEGIFEQPLHRIPKLFFYQEQKNLYLYKMSLHDYFKQYKIIRPTDYEISNFYSDKYWTNGEGSITEIGLPLNPENQYLILQTGGSHPFKNDFNRLGLKILINDFELPFYKTVNNDYYFTLDKSITKIHDIKIFSSTFIPKSLGLGEDARILGIDINAIKIE